MREWIKLNRERKIILTAGAVLLLLGAWYRFYPAVSGVFSRADEIEGKALQLGKYGRIAALRKTVERQRDRLQKTLSGMDARFLTGDTPMLAAVEVQTALNDITGASNVKIDSMRVLKPVESKKIDLVNIPVSFSIRSDVRQLKEIIYGIESADKLLIITELDIDASAQRHAGEIRASLTVEGVMKPREKNQEG